MTQMEVEEKDIHGGGHIRYLPRVKDIEVIQRIYVVDMD